MPIHLLRKFDSKSHDIPTTSTCALSNTTRRSDKVDLNLQSIAFPAPDCTSKMVSQIVLLSHPRTACNMLERMLSKQPHVEYLSHPFAPARPMQIPLLDQLAESTGAHPDTASAINHAWRQGVAKWETALKEAQKAVCVLSSTLERPAVSAGNDVSCRTRSFSYIPIRTSPSPRMSPRTS